MQAGAPSGASTNYRRNLTYDGRTQGRGGVFCRRHVEQIYSDRRSIYMWVILGDITRLPLVSPGTMQSYHKYLKKHQTQTKHQLRGRGFRRNSSLQYLYDGWTILRSRTNYVRLIFVFVLDDLCSIRNGRLGMSYRKYSRHPSLRISCPSFGKIN